MCTEVKTKQTKGFKLCSFLIAQVYLYVITNLISQGHRAGKSHSGPCEAGGGFAGVVAKCASV